MQAEAAQNVTGMEAKQSGAIVHRSRPKKEYWQPCPPSRTEAKEQSRHKCEDLKPRFAEEKKKVRVRQVGSCDDIGNVPQDVESAEKCVVTRFQRQIVRDIAV
jgi:hypothetical protein